MGDDFQLDRFVVAQSGTYAAALAELRAGRKQTHWSWYIFPQLLGLGSSDMSRRYAISGLAEAKGYLSHSILGPRLVECVAAMNEHAGTDADEILGSIDARKFHSCVTLLALVAEPGSVFHAALQLHFGGVQDAVTLRVLEEGLGG